MRPYARRLSLLTAAAAAERIAKQAHFEAQARTRAMLVELDSRVDRTTLARAMLRAAQPRATVDDLKLMRDAVKKRVARGKRELAAGDGHPPNVGPRAGATHARAAPSSRKEPAP